MKRIIFLVTLLGMLLQCGNVQANTNQQIMQKTNQTETTKISERNGILLDIARNPLTKNQIEQIIAQLNPNSFSYLILHFNDDEHVAFKSKTLGNLDDKQALSQSDLKQITAYAKKRQIIIVPDFDTPGHCKALLKLLAKNHPRIARQVKLDDNTLDYTKERTMKLVKQINSEINVACKDQSLRYFMMGGDEISGSVTHKNAIVKYFNRLNNFENQKNFRTIIWNDSVMKNSKLSDKITIAYWAQGGANENQKTLQQCYQKRATVNELLKHPLINANVNYNYLNLSDLNNQEYVSQFITKFMQNDPQNYNEIDSQNWTNDPNQYQAKVKTSGQLICLWGGGSKPTFDQIFQVIKALNNPS